MISEFVTSYFKTIPHGQSYINEAKFGLKYLEPSIANLPAGAKVLEVGSGPCILLHEISSKYKHLEITGIEPMADGFEFFSDFQAVVKKHYPGLRVHLGGYESFRSHHKWDLIFLINVFEHLSDWQHFLRFAKNSLSENGKCVILCPNYSFPYESHFAIPIIFNKYMTGKIFRHHIHKFEIENNCRGLWKSLNFVKLGQVLKFSELENISVRSSPTIVVDMIDRLSLDSEFARRQKYLFWPAKFLQKSGLLFWLVQIPFVKKLLPYMHLEVEKLPVA